MSAFDLLKETASILAQGAELAESVSLVLPRRRARALAWAMSVGAEHLPDWSRGLDLEGAEADGGLPDPQQGRFPL